MKRSLITAVGAALLLVFTAVAITNVRDTEHKLQLQQVQLQNRSNELKIEVEQGKLLEQKLNDGTMKSQQEIDTLKKEIEDRKQNELRLERELQAKLERKEAERVAAEQRRNALVNTVTATATASAAPKQATVATGGSCNDWKAAAGIPNTYATNTLINNESGCNPAAWNASSGACGIPQALPCSKMGCELNANGAVCQLRWMDTYVKSRYGTWDNALSTWKSRCGSPQGCWY